MMISGSIFKLFVVLVFSGLWLSANIPNAVGMTSDLAPGESLGIALGISAVPNLRDIGGYGTQDGATVKQGVVYRSNVFNPMTTDDKKKIEEIGLKSIIDLRTATEKDSQPDQVPSGIHHEWLNVLADQKSSAAAQLGALLHDPQKANEELGKGKIDAMFIKVYRELVSLPSANQAYRKLFLSLTDNTQTPLVFHCTTGKDRTGWATAALLTLLGVPEETVFKDFLLSSEYLLPHFQKTIDSFSAAGGDRAIPVAIFGVKRPYLEASFDEVEKRYGTIENYFSQVLGISVADQKILRDLLLEAN